MKRLFNLLLFFILVAASCHVSLVAPVSAQRLAAPAAAATER